MDALIEELKKALKEKRLYSFIANYGMYFNKDELITIIKELDYAIYSICGEKQLTEVESEVANNID